MASILKKSWKAIISKPMKFLFITSLDIAFIAVFILLNFLINLAIPNDTQFISNMQASTILLVGAILAVAAYLVILVLVYSFFSLIILGSIKSMSTDHKHDFSMYKRMFGLNMMLFMLFFIMLIAFDFIVGLMANQSVWLAAAVGIIMLVLLLLLYVFYNFTHSAFILRHELSHNLKASFRHTFTKSYLGIILFDISVIIVYVLLYLAAGLIFPSFMLANQDSITSISSVITIIIVYLLFSFNRVYFYFVAEKHIGHK